MRAAEAPTRRWPRPPPSPTRSSRHPPRHGRSAAGRARAPPHAETGAVPARSANLHTQTRVRRLSPLGSDGDAMKEIVILGGARTAMADYNGQFARLTEIELGAAAARGAFEKTG